MQSGYATQFPLLFRRVSVIKTRNMTNKSKLFKRMYYLQTIQYCSCYSNKSSIGHQN